MKRTLLTLMACLFALTIIMTSCGTDYSNPESVGKAFTTAWAQADFKKMMKLSNENHQQNILWQVGMLKADDDYEAYISDIKSESWKFLQDGELLNKDANNVSITYMASFMGDPYSLKSILGLTKEEDGKWKVTYFQKPQ